MRLILIRHGRSHHADRKFLAGSKGCTGLSELGQRQAAAVGARLKEAGLENAIYLASPVARAKETAEIIAQKLGVSVTEEPFLACFDPGAADGMPHADYADKYGFFDLPAFPDRPISPGGDSWSSYMRQVRGGLEQLKKQYEGKTIVAATHGEFVMMSMLILLRVTDDAERAFLDPENTSITEWDLSGPRVRLVRYNDASHLDGVSAAGAE